MLAIPVHAHFVTLTISTPEIVTRNVQVGRQTRTQRERVMRTREIPPTRTPAALTQSLREVNRIFGAADIEFQIRTTTTDRTEAPRGAEALDDAGFLMLAASYPMRDALSLLLVRRFTGSEGGAAVERLGVCAVGDAANDNGLAHEFGHLLGLEHQGDIRDLMNAGMSVPGVTLTEAEIRQVRNSRIVQRFSQPGH